MIICDDYLALRAMNLGRPAQVPNAEALAMTPSTWWRILRPAHAVIASRATGQPQTATGQLSRLLDQLSDGALDLVRRPDSSIIQRLDSSDLLDTAAALGVNYRGGLLQLEAAAAAVVHGGELWYGLDRNISPVTETIAADLGITINVVDLI